MMNNLASEKPSPTKKKVFEKHVQLLHQTFLGYQNPCDLTRGLTTVVPQLFLNKHEARLTVMAVKFVTAATFKVITPRVRGCHSSCADANLAARYHAADKLP